MFRVNDLEVSGSRVVLAANNFILYAPINENNSTVTFTGSTYLVANNLAIGLWHFESYEMYTGLAPGPASIISGSGISYYNGFIQTVNIPSNITGSGIPVLTYMSPTTGLYTGIGPLFDISRKGIMNVTGSPSKFQISFARNAGAESNQKLLYGSYIKFQKL
jgi:hypothetical protein